MPQQLTTKSAARRPGLSALSLVFISSYACQGLAQHFCMIAQPLNNFLKSGLKLDAVSVSMAVSLLMLPWVVKPIYGLLSDAQDFARAGDRRRRFLAGVHIAAALAYCVLALLLALGGGSGPYALYLAVGMVALAGIFIAFSTVVFVSITVEHGREGKGSRLFFGEQAVAYSTANIAAVFIGGQLCGRLSPSMAFIWALALSAGVLFLQGFFLNRFLRHPSLNKQQVQDIGDGAAENWPRQSKNLSIWVKSKTLLSHRPFLITLLFLTLWNLSPSLGVSLYFYECDKLRFTQGQIGTMAACTSAGTLIGAFIFRFFLARLFKDGRSTYFIVVLGVISNLSYLMLTTPASGMVIELFRGFATFVATLAIYGLAADVSPRGLTATAMAVQIAVFNLASEGSIALGGFLYGRLFNKELLPLIVVSSVTTLLTAFLIPYLTSTGCKQAAKAAG